MSCTKKGYTTQRQANEVINFAKKRHSKYGRKGKKKISFHGNVPVRSYLCPECDLWHLTSKK